MSALSSTMSQTSHLKRGQHKQGRAVGGGGGCLFFLVEIAVGGTETVSMPSGMPRQHL